MENQKYYADIIVNYVDNKVVSFEAVPGTLINNALQQVIEFLRLHNLGKSYILKFNDKKLEVNAYSSINGVLQDYFNDKNSKDLIKKSYKTIDVIKNKDYNIVKIVAKPCTYIKDVVSDTIEYLKQTNNIKSHKLEFNGEELKVNTNSKVEDVVKKYHSRIKVDGVGC